MTKSQFSDWDTTAANNSDINDIPLAESQMRVHHTNNAIREVMAQLRSSIEPGAEVNNFSGSTGSTDNRLLRADGTGGATIQASPITVDDSGNMSGVGTLGVGAITTTGLLTVDGQIKFPATQNASSDANTLDDYEEGTWTPSVGGDATYTTQSGTYTKIGRMVFIQGELAINVKGTGSASSISGLPVAAASPYGTVHIAKYTLVVATTYLALQIGVGGATVMQLQGQHAAATGNGGWIGMGDGTVLYFSGQYSA